MRRDLPIVKCYIDKLKSPCSCMINGVTIATLAQKEISIFILPVTNGVKKGRSPPLKSSHRNTVMLIFI